MKSPITGKEMKVMVKKDTIDFRKETFEILHHHYLDEETGAIFTDETLDTLNLNQAYNKYREKNKIPFPDAIKGIRAKYDLSAAKLADVLGFGTNVYRQYETGEVPSVSNARLIELAKDPEEFKKLVSLSGVFSNKVNIDFFENLEKLIKEKWSFADTELPRYLMEGIQVDGPGINTGYKTPSLQKLIEMVIYFTETVRPWKTKMNKLLFYADFLHFKKTCFSISGAEYVAIDLGPVPQNFNSIFEYAATNNDIDITYKEFSNGGVGEFFSPNKNRAFNADLFEESELAILDIIVKTFKETTTQEMIDLSHEEPAWLENINEMKKIKYDYAFTLKHVS
jgi:transcriptional regulator with XRE-family HTH domain